MSDAIMFMTALVPTTGHQRLLRFAQDFLCSSESGAPHRLFLIISTRGHEPTDFEFREKALREGLLAGKLDTFILHHADDAAPQSPEKEDDHGFWGYWKEVSKGLCGQDSFDYVFASEGYGADLARIFGASFIPVDLAREVLDVRGTDVRRNLFSKSSSIAVKARAELSTSWVLFGQESVGKTTLARILSQTMPGSFHHEWARPYLETVGADVTPRRMEEIFRGQLAVELGSLRDDRYLLRFLDTDLLSTIGYYNISGISPHPQIEQALLDMSAVSNKRYLLLSDKGVPFEPDPLRYGGDKRESSFEFWENMLIERDLPYHVISGSGVEARAEQIRRIILDTKPRPGIGSYQEIISFERD